MRYIMRHHHHKVPFVTAGFLVVVTVLTGVGTFTDYWGVASVGPSSIAHTGIYHWGKSDANSLFNRDPGWLKCVVVCQLMAFSFELLFCLLMVPVIFFRKMVPVHAACTLLSLFIFILLAISSILFAVNVSDYNILVVKLKLGWSWGVSLAATIASLLLFLVNASATGYGTYAVYG
uniref:Uncharacterized protein n=1 Tax=Caenorhabditis japonica TaxID=281687 RepID=A0A8R1E6P3_CAEJA